MNTAALRSTTLALALLMTQAHADTLHAIGGELYQHHGSSWIFPPRIGEFTRMGAPQDVDGTIDVVAYYARETSAGRMTATVDVYPPDSFAAEAQLDAAIAAMRSPSLRRTEFAIANDVALVATNATSVTPGFDALYFVDTGSWIVKIRVRMEHANADAAAASDQFVRQQRWDSLQLTPSTCTGLACKTNE